MNRLQPNHKSSFELFHSPFKRALVLSLLLAVVTLAVYSPVTRNGFINLDDDTYILNNPHLRAGLTWNTLKWSLTSFEWDNWYPLTWLSHALDYSLFGARAGGHHLVNAILHSLSAAILFWLLYSATGFPWRSFLVAALFALHPINVESVAWAAERKNVLSMLFFLLALAAYGWYARRPGLSRYGLVFLLFLLALMSKPQVVTFPFLLLLWDFWPLRRVAGWTSPQGPEEQGTVSQVSLPKLLLEKVPLLLLAIANASLTVLAQRYGHAMHGAYYSLLNRVENTLVSYVRYLIFAVWPLNLAAFYPHPTKLFPLSKVVASLFLLVVVTVVAVWQYRRRPYLIVGWFWFLGAMLPMIGLVQVGQQAMADRYAYIPYIGLFLMLVWTLAEWGARRKIPALALGTAAAAALIALGFLTHREIGYWRDSQTLWSRTLVVTQDNNVAHDSLARFLVLDGRSEEAVSHVRASLVIDPHDLQATMILGTYEHSRGHYAEAINLYKLVLLHADDPDIRADAFTNLGSAYRQLGDNADAKPCFEQALRLSPNHPIALVGLGLIALHGGDYPEAARQFSQAMKLQPTDVGYLLLARAIELEGHADQAQALRQRVSQLSPDFAAAQKEANNLLSSN